MFCVYKFIKHLKTIPQAFLFIGEPQNLTLLGYNQRFGLKHFIYVKIRAHPALAGLDPALARSRTQISETGIGTALEPPHSPLERASSGSALLLFCWFLLL